MNPILFSLLTFLAGMLIGNWLAIGRDKRKEFNDVSSPIRAWLISEIDHPTCFTPIPSDTQIDIFLSYLPSPHRRSFTKKLEHYKLVHQKAIIQDNQTGSVQYDDTTQIVAALNCLLPYTLRR